eukprot:TRINITY_DN1502_c0_g1_i2.p1 TRINITY_DN1502_c0_g1~~TRINITY_DN1502_c0_g1_i2.p1  ORF type:complete len:865 (-),score=201.99 TRINITY_DN1502_c0_g1_i2:380-2974(-)
MAVKFHVHCPTPSVQRAVAFQSLSRRVPIRLSCFREIHNKNSNGNTKHKYRKRYFMSNLVKTAPTCSFFSNGQFATFAASEDGLTVNGASNINSDDELEKMRLKLNQTLEGEDTTNGLVQSLNDAARGFELAFEKQGLTQGPLFSKAWLGTDKNAWVKTVSYQASVHALLHAIIKVTNKDAVNQEIDSIALQSVKHLCSPLENSINNELKSKDAVACEWFWSHQHPIAIEHFVSSLEKDCHFTTMSYKKLDGESISQDKENALSVFMLLLYAISAVLQLGTGRISCSEFSSALRETCGKVMNTLTEFISIDQVYYLTTEIGLQKEFLVCFGSRAATFRDRKDVAESAFWVDLLQQQIHKAINRERIWARLTTYESIEVLERDLSVFGFFVALGRRTQSFLEATASNFVTKHLSSLLSYLVGGCVLFYPQLSSVSTYQLFVEVVCEELEWLPFYPEDSVGSHDSENKSRQHADSKVKDTLLVIDICSQWVQHFIKYSAWLEKPSNIKAANFLSTCYSKLEECRHSIPAIEPAAAKTVEAEGGSIFENKIPTKTSAGIEDINSFEKELQGVDSALNRLEGLLKEIHVCGSNSDKEHLEAACTDLERIRKLKKEAEFLEASLKAKALSLQQDVKDEHIQFSRGKSSQPKTRSNKPGRANPTMKERKSSEGKRVGSVSHGLRDFILSHSAIKKNSDEDKLNCGDQNSNTDIPDVGTETAELVKGGDQDNVIGKSIGKLKEVGLDVLQGTQLLATDVASALVLVRRGLTGDELTVKEKKTLLRTLTDVASVIPIGILMLLPVTAVGHAAMLAAIKRYMPALIPSAYARDRLDLLRQLEKVKEMEANPSGFDEINREMSNVQLNTASDKS